MLKLTIAIPTYNGGRWLKLALDSIYSQNFPHPFQVIVSDDHSTDNTLSILKTYQKKFKNLTYYSHPTNQGCALNIQNLIQYLTGDIYFFLCQDDILLPQALQNTYQAFVDNPQIGCLTRSFYHFENTPSKPFRIIKPFNPHQNTLLNLKNPQHALAIFNSVGQLSGLAWRAKYLTSPFHHHTFTTHIRPFITTAKHHPIMFLAQPTIACRTESSQTRFHPEIYSPSPTFQWVTMFNDLLSEKKFKAAKQAGIKNICTHFPGLAQIKHFGSRQQLIKEIYLLAKYYPKNLFNPLYWIVSLGFLILPKKLSYSITQFIKKNYA